MKILMTTDTIGGVWTYSMDLIRALGKHNVQVFLATLGAPLSEDQLSEVRSVPHVSLHTSAYKLEWMPNPGADIARAQRWLLQLAFTLNPDVIHMNSYAFDARLFPMPVIMAGHSCVLSWWQAVKNEPAPAEWDFYEHLVKKGLQSADMVVAPSHTMMGNLLRYYGPFAAKTVVYNAADAAVYRPVAKKKMVLSMGRLWDDAKNMRLLIEASDALSCPVFIAGDGKTDNPVRLPQNVRFLGRLTKKEAAAWLSVTAVYALPALYEPFGLSVLEAAYSGCALILGDIPSLREIWNDNALYVNPHDASDLAGKINRLMQDQQLLHTYAQKALHRAESFQLADMAGSYHELYKMLIEQHRYRIRKASVQQF